MNTQSLVSKSLKIRVVERREKILVDHAVNLAVKEMF